MSDTLTDDERTAVTARADQFRHALTKNGVTDWEPFLAGVSGPARRSLLTELALLELHYRWSKGEKPTVEDYLTRFPELDSTENLRQLVVEEHKCRLRAGEGTDDARYRDRFPALFPDLQTALDSAVASGTVVQGALPRWEPMAEGVVAVSQQYALIRELGRGMFGEVWLARKNPSGIEKAIKILLQPADRDAAQRELKSLELIKNLRHPYLLATEDFWISNNRLHVVMELADGTLRSRLKHHQEQGLPGIPVDELFRYISEAAEGLDYLHAKKITHRDIKPDNILILHGHAKVADFGLARAQEQVVESMSLAGTPAYMAPEIWGGEGGPASDLYSLAFVYTELRQGKSPAKPRPFLEMMGALDAGFEFTDTIAEPEREVLRRAMARKPLERYPTCLAFVTELAAAVGLPFAGAASRVSDGPAPNPMLSAIFGGGTERDAAPPTDATDVPNSSGTVVTEPKVPKTEPARRSWLRIAGIVAVTVVLGALVWAVFLKGKNSGTDNIVYPSGTTPEAETAELIGKKAPVWVFVEKGEQKVRFRLIAPQTGPRVEPFYISETKITNRLYSGGDNDAPVMNVSALEARAFAHIEFGGDLPSEDEWDHAAGFYDQRGQEGPTLSPGRAWINEAAPASVKRPEKESDINHFGLIDMAGNGREWTRTVLARNGQKRDWTGELATGDKLVLRGRMFTLDRPLSFAILDKERKDQPQAAAPTVGSAYTGFRVVLKLP